MNAKPFIPCLCAERRILRQRRSPRLQVVNGSEHVLHARAILPRPRLRVCEPFTMRLMFFFGTNLKMHQTPDQTRAYVRALREGVAPFADVTLWVIPPFTSLQAAAEEADPRWWIGAQNIHPAEEGAYTGEVSAAMVKACGARFVMIGHAERRTLFGESEELVNQKVLAALRHGLVVMLCVGEPIAVKQADAGLEYVAQQLKRNLAGVAEAGRIWVLYEPIWSVGVGGVPADPGYVARMFDHIRHVLRARFSTEGEGVPILYGGSVDEQNCGNYAQLPHSAGMGVGRAGLNPAQFIRVLRAAWEARRRAAC